MIETSRLTHLGVAPQLLQTPTHSGKGQDIARCPKCWIALWSHYSGAGRVLAFVRVGTLDEPDAFPPDIHIYTESKQPWVVLPDAVPAFPAYYDREQYWSRESLDRRRAILSQIEARPAALLRGDA